ncbi:uncharacterized protein K489DRAFT_98319 [Dissoconium aciculare CBS 342.82]|uniref:Uncharacterized protein n=1 Tax=Dissoconium aciculare CBS 342.82 TaxID=1314786 RepID=A0A6J3MD31_9PEZI|nr:uncharacterized protein K489DRAFT_98319 [Dissoconium aciculare CBS 342.82]KAF1825788.1 hypothetical protein K489DRAFT_98319 [Dissoconium aciculare CBS 342.82]
MIRCAALLLASRSPSRRDIHRSPPHPPPSQVLLLAPSSWLLAPASTFCRAYHDAHHAAGTEEDGARCDASRTAHATQRLTQGFEGLYFRFASLDWPREREREGDISAHHVVSPRDSRAANRKALLHSAMRWKWHACRGVETPTMRSLRGFTAYRISHSFA